MARADSNVDQPFAEYVGRFPDEIAVSAVVNATWAQALKSDPSWRSKLGLSASDAVPFRVRLTQGADLNSVSLTVMATTSAIHLGALVLHDAWKAVVLPFLKRRFGRVRERAAPAAAIAPASTAPSERAQKKRTKVKRSAAKQRTRKSAAPKKRAKKR